jgi:hypothetical protein
MTLIAQNIQIQSAKRTLGELDYLIRDGDEVVHLEVAVKFYLSVTAGDHEYWVGPALRDRLDLKVRKLRERQLPIVETEGCVRWLKEKGLPQPTVQRVMLKGGLFSRETSLSGSGAKNDGWSWGRLTDFRDTDDFLWEVLRKPNWFAGCRGEGGAMSWQGLVESVECEWENFRAPVMVVRRSKLEGNPEVSRHFVVPKDWYGRALEMVQNSP